MTHLTTNAASLTNTPSATSVSPLEQSGSNKDKFLTSLEKEEIEPVQSAPINTRKAVSLGDYEQRIEHKRDRLEERALKAHDEADARFKASHDRASMIPFGQPILVGHHSEKRARRDAERIWSDMGKSVAATQKAERLESRAASVGTGGIASDDPEAITKLKAKLAALEKAQAVMKAANKAIRSTKDEAAQLDKLVNGCGLTEKQAREILTPDCCGRVGFASYALQNNNANIRTTKQRLEQLEKLHNAAPLSGSGEVNGLEWTLYEEDGRVKFSFDDKPDDETRNVLKSNGFKWSRYSRAWVRKLTGNAIHSANWIVKQFNEGVSRG